MSQAFGVNQGGGHHKPRVTLWKFLKNYIEIRARGVAVHKRAVFDRSTTVEYYDDFLGDVLRDEWNFSTGSSGTGAIVTAVNGICQLDTTSSDDDALLDWGAFYNWDPALNCAMEIRMSITNATTNFGVSLWGFYKDTDEYAVFEVDAGDDNIDCKASITGASGAVDEDSGVDIDTDYHIYLIECLDDGSVRFSIDGTLVYTAPAGTLSTVAGVLHKPYISMVDSGATQHLVDIDYVSIYQDRT